MIHIYGANTTLEDLRQVTVTRPSNAGRAWAGIPHAEVVDCILDECKLRGWGVGDMQFALARQGADLTGAVDVIIPGFDMGDDISLGIGFTTSNARRKALKMYIGGTVRLCSNGMTTGTVVLRKKHTLHTDLVTEIEQGIDRYREGVNAIPATVAAMKERHISTPDAVELVAEAGKLGLMPAGRLWDVIWEWQHPTHDHGQGTGWALYNAFTLVAKKNPPTRQLEQIEGYRKLITA